MSYYDYSFRKETAPVPAENCADESVPSGELWVRMWEARRELARTDASLDRHNRLSQEANHLYFELVMRGDIQTPLMPQPEAQPSLPAPELAQAA